MKRVLIAALPLAAVSLASCMTTKSYSACKQDVERLKTAISNTAAFLDSVEPELQAAEAAARVCDTRLGTCEAADLVMRLEILRADAHSERAYFTRANETWRPEACLDYTSTYRLNPPPPERYRAYYESYDKVTARTDELLAELEAFGG